MNRPLSLLEQAAWKLDQGIPQNFVMILRISGPLNESILRKTLEIVQEKHPPLKFRIQEGDVPQFVTENVPRIPLVSIKRKDKDHWIEVAEKEMVEPFPFTEGPLIRVKQLIDEGQCDVVFTFCHIIADGLSGVVLARNILKLADQLCQGIEPDIEPPVKMLPSSLDLLRKDIKFKPEIFDISGRILLRFHQQAELMGDEDVPIENRVTRVIQRILTANEIKKLAAKCKEEKVTIHSAVTGAFLQSVVEQIKLREETTQKKKSLMIGCTTPVNMRDLFYLPITEEIGDFISHALHFQLIDDNSTIWKAAKKVKKSLDREFKFKRDIKATRGIGELLEVFKTPTEIVKALENEFPPVAVTNLGKMDIDVQFGDLVLEEIHFTVEINPACRNGYAIAITTHKGFMTLNFLYAEPYISMERAIKMADTTIRRLKNALN